MKHNAAVNRRGRQPHPASGRLGSDPAEPREFWTLPSGQPLAEFAFRSGFVAPRLLQATFAPRRSRTRSRTQKKGAGLI